MPTWICGGCGLEHPESTEPPDHCVLDRGEPGIEEHGDIGPHGRSWRTHAELAEAPHETVRREHGRGLHSLRREPAFAIGHWSFLACTPRGNLLWDPPAYLDEEVLGVIGELGGVHAVATSHPHMSAAQVSWSHAFGQVPVFVNERDREWLPRPDPVIEFWSEHAEPLPGVELIHLGGHLRGSAVARTSDGTILSGDTITGTPVPVSPPRGSFTRNYPKLVPLSAAVVRRIVDRLEAYEYDRLYTLGGHTIEHAAKEVVRHSAKAHIRWVSGEFDELT